MKYLKIFLLMAGFSWAGVSELSAQKRQVFNDTIYFSLLQISPMGNGHARMMFGFETTPQSARQMTGTIVLSLCACYCDSIWDAWPKGVTDPVPGGAATITYMSSSGGSSPGGLSPGNTGKPLRGRLNIWKAPAGIQRNDPFTLPVMFVVD